MRAGLLLLCLILLSDHGVAYQPEPKEFAVALLGTATTVTVEPDQHQREAELYALMERAHRGEISLYEAVKQYRAKWRNGTTAEEAARGALRELHGVGGLGETINWKRPQPKFRVKY